MLNRLSEAGYNKPLSTVSNADKGEVMSALVDFYLFIKVKALMDQFRKSMETGGILKHMKASTDLLRPMFVNEKKALTAGIHNDSNTVDFRIVNLCINFLLQFSSRNF